MNLRDYRFFGLAIIDYVVTFIVIFFLHYYMWSNANVKNKNNRTYLQYFFSLFFIFLGALGLAVILHYFFNIKSTFSKYLGLND